MTLDEFLDLPDVKPYLEYEDGVVRQKVSPSYVHITLQGFLYTTMNQAAKPGRRGIAHAAWRFATPDWAPTPDVSFYRRGRVKLRNGEPPDEMFEAPDIAVEIVSPGQTAGDQISKCLRYIRLGTTIALLIDPYRKVVFGFRPNQALVEMRGDDRINLDEVLPDFVLTVRELFEAVVADLADFADEDNDDAEAVPPSASQ